MKKNKMMRLASVLLVLTMMSTSVISGTFAKYVTQDSAEDSARVARFGVTASISGDLFGATYLAADGNTITTYDEDGGTVSSAEGKDKFVVAPGTKNLKAMTLSVKGDPEVATKVIFDAAEDERGNDYADSDIYLAVGDYGIMAPYEGVKTADNCGEYYVLSGVTYSVATENDLTKDWYELRDTANVATEYHPLKWYIDDSTTAMTMEVAKEEVKAVFADLDSIAPNSFANKSVTIGWEWDYGTAWDERTDYTVTAEDKMDTVLGNMMAEQMDADSEDMKVVVMSGNNYVAVDYGTCNADYATTNSSANQIVFAYEPSSGTKLACLTVSFNARLTVEQVD